MEHGNQILETLLIVYIALLGINTVLALKLYFSYKTKPFKALVGVWLFTLINFVLQGIFMKLSLSTVLAFATYAPAAFCLIYILNVVSNRSVNFTPLAYLLLIAILVSIVLSFISNSFTAIAIPIALAIGLPQLYFGVIKLFSAPNSETPELTNVFAIFLLLNGIHFLDFPFLRPLPEAALFGFGVVIIISCVISVLLPSIIGRHHANSLTKELKDSMLESKKLAKAKSDFLANMSHEIKTPLNGIRGLTDILKTTELTDTQLSYLNRLTDSAENLLEIVDNILSATRLDSGKIELNVKAFSPTQLAKEVIQYYEIKNCHQPIEISYCVSHDVPDSVLSDKGKILQIIYNLINNALKYSEGTKIILSIDFDIEHDVHILSIEISDNGRGIDEKHKTIVFDQFTQLSDKTDGVGLGLSIVKKLIDVLKGKIVLTSHTGKGTSFVCTIPIEIVEDYRSIKEEQRTKNIEPKKEIENLLSPEIKLTKISCNNVLIVEDDPTTQLILERVFTRENFRLTVIDSAEEAISNYKCGVYSMVLTDISLKGELSGLDLLKEIRKSDHNIPIIVQSAFAFDEDMEHAQALGATEYLRKPTRISDIQSLCKKYAKPDITQSNSQP